MRILMYMTQGFSPWSTTRTRKLLVRRLPRIVCPKWLQRIFIANTIHETKPPTTSQTAKMDCSPGYESTRVMGTICLGMSRTKLISLCTIWPWRASSSEEYPQLIFYQRTLRGSETSKNTSRFSYRNWASTLTINRNWMSKSINIKCSTLTKMAEDLAKSR